MKTTLYQKVMAGFLVSLFFAGGIAMPIAYAEGEVLESRILELLVKKGVIDRAEADELLSTAKVSVKETLPETPPLPQGDLEFDFAAPQLAPPPSSSEKGLAAGPFTSLNFGGTFDSRWGAPEGLDMPGGVIHVNELLLTTNIGDRISFLGEWLLQTSDFENNVGNDHGFAYAIFSDIPYLPKNTSIKLGRFRFKYGIDAVLDAPLNPLYTPIKRNLGFASDLGVEFEGYWDRLGLEYTVALMNGPDGLKTRVTDASGMSDVFITTPEMNNSLPVVARLSREFKELGGLRLGSSYFDGRSWPFVNGAEAAKNVREMVGIQGGAVDGTMLVYKRHGSVDFSYRAESLRTDLHGEFTLGQDQYPSSNVVVRGYYLRADRPIYGNKLDLQVQFDYWEDGLSSTKESFNLGFGLKYKMTDSAFLRATYSFNGEYDDSLALQVYLPF